MRKILILEGGKTISEMMKNISDNKNYLIINSIHSSGRPVNEIPDMVIADLTSIKEEKVETLIKLKNNPSLSFVPFLLFTSGNGKGEQYSARNYYLNKNITKESLMNLIKDIFKNSNSTSPW